MNIEKKVIKALSNSKKKLTFDELQKVVGIEGEKELAFFSATLEDLEIKGKIYKNNKTYQIFDKSLGLVQAQIYISRSGEGYVRVKNGDRTSNYIIYNQDLNGALPNDIVLIKPANKNYFGHELGSVERIVKRNNRCEIYEYMGNGIFEIYNVKSNLKIKLNNGASSKMVVSTLVTMTVSEHSFQIDSETYYKGEIRDIVGYKDDPTAQLKALGYRCGFDEKFSKKVYDAVKQIPTEVSEEEIKSRVDLRDKTIFTIDGFDTKDVDDAISLERDGEDYILSVHIADVPYYIKDFKEILDDAFNRGNSAYFADSVFPMLHHILSNGICSLNPNVDRLTKTVEIRYNKNGKRKSAEIYESVINSKKKMTYENVNSLFYDNEVISGYEKYIDILEEMRNFSKIIKAESLGFDSREIKITTDERSRPVFLKLRKQGIAEKLIERFMIEANVVVSEQYGYIDRPFIFRVHESPNSSEVLKTLLVIKEQGICPEKPLNELIEKCQIIDKSKKGKLIPADFIPFLRSIERKEYEMAVSNAILKTMKRAIYSSKNIGHFGLDKEYYSHFTSPIRRAADLFNHLVISYLMELNTCIGTKREKEIEQILNTLNENVANWCEHFSLKELMAEEGEKLVEKVMQAQYVANNVIDYEGPLMGEILNINKFGMIVLVDNRKIKAEVDVCDLNNYGYYYKRESRTFTNKQIKHSLKLGDKIALFNLDSQFKYGIIKYKAVGKEEEDLLGPEPKRILRRKHRI